MRRIGVGVLLCVSVLFSALFLAGCQIAMHGYTHPHSEITAPTFCLYEGSYHSKDATPHPIYRLAIRRWTKINDEPIEWDRWKEYWSIYPASDQHTWEIEYVGDDQDITHTFSCITYGEAPPGYTEHVPPQPLIPERIYQVQILPRGRTPMSWVHFVLRADSMGRPIQLEVLLSRRRDMINNVNNIINTIRIIKPDAPHVDLRLEEFHPLGESGQ